MSLLLDAFFPRFVIFNDFIPALIELKTFVQKELDDLQAMGEMHDFITYYFDRKNIRTQLESYVIEVFPLLH
jgi:hypothetical protein